MAIVLYMLGGGTIYPPIIPDSSSVLGRKVLDVLVNRKAKSPEPKSPGQDMSFKTNS
jgi:hypothetical protein